MPRRRGLRPRLLAAVVRSKATLAFAAERQVVIRTRAMYEVDGRDRVTDLVGVPQSSVGAPNPLVISDEHRVVLAYYVEVNDPAWDGRTVRVVGPTEVDEPIAIIRFKRCYAHVFGPPDDEVFAGHPLASRGLHPYGAFEVSQSSWIRRLEKMYSAPEVSWGRRHIIFAFHDSTFECVCDGFEVRPARGSVESVVPEMVKLLEWSAG
jgi:hypothetical protein